MTAINIICQNDWRCVVTATDTAYCDSDGVLVEVGTRVFDNSDLTGAIIVRGANISETVLAKHLSGGKFNFEDDWHKVGAALPSLIADANVTTPVELFFARWSKKQDEAQAYVIGTTSTTLIGWDPKRNEQEGYPLKAFQPYRLPQIVLIPAPERDLAIAMSFTEKFDTWWETVPRDVVISNLKVVVNAQRRSTYDGLSLVGGSAEWNLIDEHWLRRGLREPSIVWNEDRVGQRIHPTLMD